MLDDAGYIMKHYNSTSKSLTPGEVYLEGEVLYFDDEGVVIIYQDQLGKKADRFISRIDADGNVKWTKSTKDELFNELKLDEDEDAFSKMFFIKNKLKGDRGGKMFILKMTGVGILCFDWEDGEKIWEMEM
jgi:outer membrane protein assembly factor BamB